MYRIPDRITEIGRNLRKNMTDAEMKIWNELKNSKLGVKFLRQRPLYLFTEDDGRNRFIIPDFYCKELNLILEIDGSIHDCEDVIHFDNIKEELLKKKDLKVLRVLNKDIYSDIHGVLKRIKEQITLFS